MRLFKINPLLKLVNSYVVDSPQPSNLSYWWNFGSLLAFSLIIQIITGVTLAMHYNTDILEAFNSVEHIMRDINNGWLIRYLHSNTASAFFFIVYLHIGRGLYYGSFKAPRMLTWIIGTVILIVMMGTAFMGYVLPFGQMSLWGATVITSLMSAIPWVGQDIVEFIWGGFSVNGATLNRFFALHFVLPFVLAALALMHLIALHDKGGSGNPLGISGNPDRLPFAPYYIFKDLITIFIFILVLSIFVFYMPNILGDSENYVVANPMQTPSAIVPEWYLLAFYAILRSIPNKLLGVIAMLSAILMLLTTSLSDITKLRGIQFRPLSKAIFFFFLANFLILTQLGAQHVELPFIEYGQASTVIYFLYFFMIIPYLCLFEGSVSRTWWREKIFDLFYFIIWYSILFYRTKLKDVFIEQKSKLEEQYKDTPFNYVVVQSCFPGIPNSVARLFGYPISRLFSDRRESHVNINANANANASVNMNINPHSNANPNSYPNADFNYPSNYNGDLIPFDPNSGGRPMIDLATFTNKDLAILDDMILRLPDVGRYGIEQADALQYHLPNLFQIWHNFRCNALFTPQEDMIMYRIASQMLDYCRTMDPSLPYDFSSIKPVRDIGHLNEALQELFDNRHNDQLHPHIMSTLNSLNAQAQTANNNTGITQQALNVLGGRFPRGAQGQEHESLETSVTGNIDNSNSNSSSNDNSSNYQGNNMTGNIIPGSENDAPRPWGYYFQDSGTPQMEALVELHDNIMFYLIIILFGVGGLISTIINKYGDMRSPLSQRFTSHGTSVEVIWTLTPAIILLLIALPSYKLLYLMDEITDPILVIFMQGYQWYWNSQYIDFIKDDDTVEFDSYLVPEPDLQEGALRMLEVDNRIIVPELTHTRFVVGGGDVIHSFACPSLGIKCDAYPGRLNQSSVMLNRLSTYYGQCSEICGILHSSMPIVIQSVTSEKFVKWVLGQ